jgi:Glycosyltransferase family 87
VTSEGRAQAATVPLGARSIRIPALEPHAALACGAAAMLLAELLAVKQGSAAWIVLGAVAAGCAFLVAWRSQERLRLVPLLAITLAFQLSWIVLVLALGVTSLDSAVLYRLWGDSLVHGHYPNAQYPPAAVLLFGLDSLLGGGPTRVAHAFLMVPFQLVTVAAVWSLQTRRSAWLAALVALWPLDAFSWVFRFDLFPTALLALGLLLAWRERWALSGALLGFGAAAKWTPALAAAALLVWLLSNRRTREAVAHALAFALVFVLIHLPFLIWSPSHTLYSYRYFHRQGVTGESIWYLVLAPLGRATVPLDEFWLPAHVPSWANPMTTVAQVAVLLALGVASWRVRTNLRAGVAVAATAPVLFLLLNRVFSPQYLVLMLVAWAIAGALLLERPSDQLVLGAAIMAATTANALVYPYTLQQAGIWRLCSAAMFALGLWLSAWLVWRAIRLSDSGASAAGGLLRHASQ